MIKEVVVYEEIYDRKRALSQCRTAHCIRSYSHRYRFNPRGYRHRDPRATAADARHVASVVTLNLADPPVKRQHPSQPLANPAYNAHLYICYTVCPGPRIISGAFSMQ